MSDDVPEYADADPRQRRAELDDALVRSRQGLREAAARGPEVTRVTESLRTMRSVNRYGERMALAMRRAG